MSSKRNNLLAYISTYFASTGHIFVHIVVLFKVNIPSCIHSVSVSVAMYEPTHIIKY